MTTTANLLRIGLLDDRNIDLYKRLLETQQITTVLDYRSDYLLYTIDKTAKIAVPRDKIHAASYTHELLHIFLRSREIFIGGGLIAHIESKPKLEYIFSRELKEHIDNTIDHIKMLPLFLQLGYPREQFIQDDAVNKFSLEDLGYIVDNFRKSFLWKKWYDRKGIDRYIGNYFAAKACANPALDYTFQLKQLEKLEPDLFEILETFMNAWRKFDFDAPDPWDRNYHRFSLPFIEQLDKWASTNKIK